MPGANVLKKVLERVSLNIGAPLRNLEEGLCVEEGSGIGVFPYRGLVGEPVEGESIYWEL